MYKVSVIVPIYNGEKYIHTCLDSLAAQTLKDIQVIIINDGSQDDSEKVCMSYVNKYPNFQYHYKENGGSASARNVGLENAEGEYIGFVDSDDSVVPEMFEKMYSAAKSNDADIVYNAMREKAQLRSFPFSVPQPGYYDAEQMKADILPELLPHPTKTGTFRSFDWGNWSKIIKREVIEKNHIRYYNKSRRCEDLCFAFECTIHAKSYYVMEPEPLYHYTPSETSKSRHYTKNMWRSISSLMRYLMELDEQYPDYDFSEAVQYCILYFCVIVIRNEAFGLKDKHQLQRIQEILDDDLCKNSLYLSERDIYNKEYTAIFKAMRSNNARKVYNTLHRFAWKKKHLSPILSKLKR